MSNRVRVSDRWTGNEVSSLVGLDYYDVPESDLPGPAMSCVLGFVLSLGAFGTLAALVAVACALRGTGYDLIITVLVLLALLTFADRRRWPHG